MARFTNGWIKAWRKAAESDLVDNLIVWGLWHWLLYAATWQPQKKLIDGKQRILPPGAVLFSPKEVAEIWGCSESVVRKWLKYLHDTGRIVREPCRRGTLITICNWDTYQGTDDPAYVERVDGVLIACASRADGEHLNKEVKKERKKTARTGVRAEYSEAFEGAWEAYGREGKKGAAAKAYRELDLTQEESGDLLKAIAAYLADCAAKDRFKMHMATFLRDDWRPWLDRAPKPLREKTVQEVLGGI